MAFRIEKIGVSLDDDDQREYYLDREGYLWIRAHDRNNVGSCLRCSRSARMHAKQCVSISRVSAFAVLEFPRCFDRYAHTYIYIYTLEAATADDAYQTERDSFADR